MQISKTVSFFTNRISRNIVFWLAFAFFHYFPRNNLISYLIILSFVSFAYGAPIYINNLLLIPQYLIKRKYFLYCLLLIILLAAATAETYFMNRWAGRFLPPSGYASPLDNMAWPYHILQIISLFALLAFGKFLNDAIKNERGREFFQKQQLEAELESLRSQINPHFLFNALNTIYGMARRTDHETAEAVLQLSNILRHNLYGTNETEISICKEIEAIDQYVSFAQLRLHRKESIRLTINAAPKNQKIVPMLLLPFIENAFKHGFAHDPDSSWAAIELSLIGDEFSFFCENSNNTSNVNNGKGIGLKNVQRRLQLCYPRKHKLQINNDSEKYTVRLKILLT